MMSRSAGRGTLSGCQSLSRRLRHDLGPHFLRRSDYHKSSILLKGFDLQRRASREYAESGIPNGGRLAVHRAAPAHNEVTEPK